MAKLSVLGTRAIIGAVVAAIVVVAGYFVFFNGDSTKSVTAQFNEAVGVYVGTPVRILGVGVGEVTSVKPKADYVEVTMTYDSKYRIAAKGASATEVANSLVSDRYIELGPLISATNPAKALGSKATIKTAQTGGPAELDQIYAQLDRLSVALGPKGANAGGQSSGALSALLKVSAANLKGNGAALGQSITNLAAAARTLSDNKGNLFATVKNLQKFTSTLKASDSQVRLFNQQLAQVAGDLAGERTDLGAALQELGVALDSVNTFVKGNAAKFHTDIKGLENITSLLVRQKASLNETLAIAPVALANITHAYSPEGGTLGTRSNLLSLVNLGANGSLLNPVTVLCNTLSSLSGVLSGISGAGGLLNTVCPTTKSGSSATSSKTATTSSKTTSSKTTSSATTSSTGTGLSASQANYVLETMLNGGVPVGTLIGSSK